MRAAQPVSISRVLQSGPVLAPFESSDVDPAGGVWQHAGVEDLFADKRPRSRLRIFGSVSFALLGVASIVDAVRDSPLVLGDRVVGPLAERLGYRVGAALFCLALSVLLFPRTTGERDRL